MFAAAREEPAARFFQSHCYDCHNADLHEARLDLSALSRDYDDPQTFARWVKVYDRIRSGEMPPKDQPRPPQEDAARVTGTLHDALVAADETRRRRQGRAALRRLTRSEYENTVRDLLDLPGIALHALLPADGSTHGFDKHADSLDMSHVQMAKYVEAADRALDMAIAVQPEPPTVYKERLSLASTYIVRHVIMNGDGVLLKDKRPDPDFPPAGRYKHVDQGAHERAGVFNPERTVALFRHDDESFKPAYNTFATLYPGRYRIRASFWSFQWDQGRVLPSRGVEAARLSAVQLRGNGRGSGEGSRVLGYFDAPSIESRVHSFETWLNYKETIGFNTASLVPVAIYYRKDHALGYTGPAIANDWLEVEGPLHDRWPPESHRRLFGELPLRKFDPAGGQRPPPRVPPKQEILSAHRYRPDPWQGVWTVYSEQPEADARRLLGEFLPRAFRRPVDDAVLRQYVDLVLTRLAANDCFESALRFAYRAALCSPDFLYRVEQPGPLDNAALASRLSYFLWNSMPDEQLLQSDLAANSVLRAQAERLLHDPKSERFVNDFLDQWLKLRDIANTDPDRKLYPEFSVYLQDAMLAETRAYFRELLDSDLPAAYLVRSDFCMLNQKLAEHYGLPRVEGVRFRRVALPEDSPRRGGFLTQAAILKLTANGTTTSPVTRGAFVMDRLLGEPPAPPPPDLPAIEPDVRGATTIREQLAKHRNQADLRFVPSEDRPAGFRLGSLRRDRRLAGPVPLDRRGRQGRPFRLRSESQHQLPAGTARRFIGRIARRTEV